MNSLSLYKTRIKSNFRIYDAFLDVLRAGSQTYKICFALRTSYAVYQEVYERQGGNTIRSAVKQVLKLALQFLLVPFHYHSLTDRGRVTLLGKGERDRSVAEYIGLPYAAIRREQKLFRPRFRNLRCYPRILRAWAVLLGAPGLNKRYVVTMLLAQAIDVVLIREQIDVREVKVIVAENDIDPEIVAVLQAAKERSIPTVKVEYVLIDDTHHNNVFCDYYFYPSQFHRYIREKFEINRNLKYIDGGFPNWDVAARYTYAAQASPRIICFFTQHGGLSGDRDELFYLEELLSLLDERYTITIKVHPLDRTARYERFRKDPRCTIVDDRTVDNYALIARSYLCISLFSVISLEAKLICNRSIFLNFDGEGSDSILEYERFEPCFDVVRSREALKAVLNDTFLFKSRDVFLKNVCMTYPDTKGALLTLLERLIAESQPDERAHHAQH